MSETRKNRKKKQKKAMWDQFEEYEQKSRNLECVYEKEKSRDFCDACSHILQINDDGFLICTNHQCGKMFTDTLEQSAEWRFYGNNDSSGDDPARTGPPVNPLLKESSFGCRIICHGGASYEMRKVRRYAEWQSMPYKEKSQYNEFQRITLLAGHAGISKLIIDDAIRYHKMISEAKTFRGHNRHGIIAASIYIAARLNSYPRSAKEIATIFHLDNASATKGCKNALVILNELECESEDKTTLCKTTPQLFMDRYCSKLNINAELTQLCNFIAMRVDKNNLIPENTPLSIAAGIIYFVAQECNLNITKQEINNISEISEVTINKCYKKLDTMKNKLLPKVIIDKYSN